MSKIRVHAWIEPHPKGGWVLKTNQGTHTMPSYNLESLQSQCDHINNEDSDGHYFEVADKADYDAFLEERAEARRRKEKLRAIREERAEVRRNAEKKKVEQNRKSKKKSEIYFYIISMIERGANKSTVYFSGETNLLTMKKFTVDNAEKSKVFNTKASAQKVVDTLENNRIIYKLYRNIKVVQKKKDLFS